MARFTKTSLLSGLGLLLFFSNASLSLASSLKTDLQNLPYSTPVEKVVTVLENHLSEVASLETFDLGRYQYGSEAKSLSKLYGYLENMKGLKTLNLQYSKFNETQEKQAIVLAQIASKLPQLESLVLFSFWNLNHSAVDSVMEIVSRIASLRSLEIPYLSEEAAKQTNVAEKLAKLVSLRVFISRGGDLGTGVSDYTGIERLINQGFTKLPLLESIDLSSNVIGIRGAELLAHGLYFMPKLKKLRLKSTYALGPGWVALRKAQHDLCQKGQCIKFD